MLLWHLLVHLPLTNARADATDQVDRLGGERFATARSEPGRRDDARVRFRMRRVGKPVPGATLFVANTSAGSTSSRCTAADDGLVAKREIAAGR